MRAVRLLPGLLVAIPLRAGTPVPGPRPANTANYTVALKWDAKSQFGLSAGYMVRGEVTPYELATATRGWLVEAEIAIHNIRANLGYWRRTLGLSGSTGWTAKVSWLHWLETRRQGRNYVGVLAEGWFVFAGLYAGFYSSLESRDSLILVGMQLRL